MVHPEHSVQFPYLARIPSTHSKLFVLLLKVAKAGEKEVLGLDLRQAHPDDLLGARLLLVGHDEHGQQLHGDARLLVRQDLGLDQP